MSHLQTWMIGLNGLGCSGCMLFGWSGVEWSGMFGGFVVCQAASFQKRSLDTCLTWARHDRLVALTKNLLLKKSLLHQRSCIGFDPRKLRNTKGPRESRSALEGWVDEPLGVSTLLLAQAHGGYKESLK